MRLVRTILAFAIAASLALLPVGASATAAAMGSAGMGAAMGSGDPQPGMHMQMGASGDMSMEDCCPDDMTGAPAPTAPHKCDMGFCCIGGALALGELRMVVFEFRSAGATSVAIPADQIVPTSGSSPPFRPPRV
ncbi:hypothetical protein ACQR1W_07780 [Bradyrhizobium sp. HKCCYLS1011]|uniref:hypothetical protein n=1 Tax=Bradyrhizobium sp. HKCCYLS1011 TaxID=3420733 RepID=UPI003EB731F3